MANASRPGLTTTEAQSKVFSAAVGSHHRKWDAEADIFALSKHNAGNAADEIAKKLIRQGYAVTRAEVVGSLYRQGCQMRVWGLCRLVNILGILWRTHSHLLHPMLTRTYRRSLPAWLIKGIMLVKRKLERVWLRRGNRLITNASTDSESRKGCNLVSPSGS